MRRSSVDEKFKNHQFILLLTRFSTIFMLISRHFFNGEFSQIYDLFFHLPKMVYPSLRISLYRRAHTVAARPRREVPGTVPFGKEKITLCDYYCARNTRGNHSLTHSLTPHPHPHRLPRPLPQRSPTPPPPRSPPHPPSPFASYHKVKARGRGQCHPDEECTPEAPQSGST